MMNFIRTTTAAATAAGLMGCAGVDLSERIPEAQTVRNVVLV
ncbi:MAG: alpha/beta hydrolase, partial [Burkholderiales bacterium]